MAQSIRWILFDLDGTLIDTSIYKEVYDRIIDMILDRTGQTKEELQMKLDFFQMKRSKEGRYDTGDLCQTFGLMQEYYSILQEEMDRKDYLKLHVKEVLQKIRAGSDTKVAILSNSFSSTAMLYLEIYGLEGYVDIIVGKDMTSTKKSDAAYWRYVIDIAKIVPYSSVMVGDSLLEDVVLPKQSGFRTVHIRKDEDILKVLKLIGSSS